MDDQQVKDLARKIMAVASPDHLDAFDSGVDDLIDDPDLAMPTRPTSGGPLAADLGTVFMEMTPIVIYVARRILDEFVSAAAGELGKRAVSGLRWPFRRAKTDPARPVPDPPEETKIMVINVVVRDATKKYRLDENEIRLLTKAARVACELPPATGTGSGSG